MSYVSDEQRLQMALGRTAVRLHRYLEEHHRALWLKAVMYAERRLPEQWRKRFVDWEDGYYRNMCDREMRGPFLDPAVHSRAHVPTGLRRRRADTYEWIDW
jgi:hypothetical protein